MALNDGKDGSHKNSQTRFSFLISARVSSRRLQVSLSQGHAELDATSLLFLLLLLVSLRRFLSLKAAKSLQFQCVFLSVHKNGSHCEEAVTWLAFVTEHQFSSLAKIFCESNLSWYSFCICTSLKPLVLFIKDLLLSRLSNSFYFYLLIDYIESKASKSFKYYYFQPIWIHLVSRQLPLRIITRFSWFPADASSTGRNQQMLLGFSPSTLLPSSSSFPSLYPSISLPGRQVGQVLFCSHSSSVFSNFIPFFFFVVVIAEMFFMLEHNFCKELEWIASSPFRIIN